MIVETTRTLNLVVVEDEAPARRLLRAHVARRSELRLLELAIDGSSGVAAIKRHAPDLVLLDVEMPGLDGFGVLSELRRSSTELPQVVFVTAYNRYAVRAFEVNAVDYLLKPVTHNRFDEAIDRCLTRTKPGQSRNATQELLEDALHVPPQRLLVRERGRIVPIPVQALDWIEAEGDYVRLHSGKNSYLIERTLTKMETVLASRGFVRIHRRTLVNLRRIRELKSEGSGRYRVLLEDGTELMASRTYSLRFRGDLL